jgi:hypothetical protein
MYYSSGNYEAFSRPRKPKGVENKTAWFVGSGLAALAGAAFLIRDGKEIDIPGPVVSGQSSDEQARQNPDRRAAARVRYCRWRMTRLLHMQRACRR